MEPSRDDEVGNGAFPYAARLVLRDGQRMLTIEVDEISWIEAAGNYVQIYTPRKTYLVRHTVKAMETKLDPARFIRVRPSAIVAVKAVLALNARAGGDYTVVLLDGTEIRTSRSFRDRVEETLAEAAGTARHALTNRRRRRARAAARKMEAATAAPAPTPASTTTSAVPPTAMASVSSANLPVMVAS